MLTSALSNAVEKAMESDVEYRRGLPVNLASFMGSGVVCTDISKMMNLFHLKTSTPPPMKVLRFEAFTLLEIPVSEGSKKKKKFQIAPWIIKQLSKFA